MAIPPPVLTALSAYLIDLDNPGTPLYAKASRTARANGSTTKLATALTANDYMPAWSDNIPISSRAYLPPASAESKAGVRVGEVFNALDLLHGMLLPSGNDAAVAIAEYVGRTYLGVGPGGTADQAIAAFMTAVNAKMAALGMTDTTFVTPSGLDATGHATSARDMCLLGAAAFAVPVIKQVCGTVSVAAAPLSGAAAGQAPYRWQNNNDGLSHYQARAMKGGSTPNTGSAAIVLHECGGKRWVFALLKANNGFSYDSPEAGQASVANQVALARYAEAVAGVSGVLTGRTATNNSLPGNGTGGGAYSTYLPGVYLGGYAREYPDGVTGFLQFAFYGDTARLITALGPNRGRFTLSVDGAAPVLFDCYSATPQMGAVAGEITGLDPGVRHVVTVTATGTKSVASSSTLVGIDEMEFARTVGTVAVSDRVFDVWVRPVGSLTWPYQYADLTAGAFDVTELTGGAYEAQARQREVIGGVTVETGLWSAPQAFAVAGVDTFEIQVRPTGGTFATFTTQPAGTYDFPLSFAPGIGYEARVRALRSDGTPPSDWGPIVAFSPPLSAVGVLALPAIGIVGQAATGRVGVGAIALPALGITGQATGGSPSGRTVSGAIALPAIQSAGSATVDNGPDDEDLFRQEVRARLTAIESGLSAAQDAIDAFPTVNGAQLAVAVRDEIERPTGLAAETRAAVLGLESGVDPANLATLDEVAQAAALATHTRLFVDPTRKLLVDSTGKVTTANPGGSLTALQVQTAVTDALNAPRTGAATLPAPATASLAQRIDTLFAREVGTVEPSETDTEQREVLRALGGQAFSTRVRNKGTGVETVSAGG